MASRPLGRQVAPRTNRRVRIAGALMTLLGALVLLFLLYMFVFTNFQEMRTQHRLVSALSAAGLSFAHHQPADGDPIGVLTIRSIGLDVVVVQGSNAGDLESGPGLMPGSAPIGVAGNTVIAGRRLTFGHPFAKLNHLEPGDRVQLAGANGRFAYRVVRIFSVRPGQRDPIGRSSDARLTLVTSDPPLVATGRLVAVAEQTSRPVRGRVPSTALRQASELGLGGDGSAATPSLFWGECFALALAVTVVAYRRWNQTWATYILSTPVLIALAILFFENVAKLLPATL